MKRIIGLVTLIVVFLSGSVFGTSLTAQEIVARIDEYRLFNVDFEMKIRIENYLNNNFENAIEMKGYVQDGAMTSLVFLEPASMKDRKIVVNGNDISLIIPKVKNPIHISPSQRLVGGISYSDVAAVSYAQGYNASLLGEAVSTGLDSAGKETDARQCLIVQLETEDMSNNYNKIDIWVDQQDFLPVKADFFALSGKKMATVYYTGLKSLGDRKLITKMFFFDQIDLGKHFSMEYYDIKIAELIEN